MNEQAWFWPIPLKVLESQGGPYLRTAEGTIGGHRVSVHCSSAADAAVEFRVFLDGQGIFEQGQTTPALAWYQLCDELGYQAGEKLRHLDQRARVRFRVQVVGVATFRRAFRPQRARCRS